MCYSSTDTCVTVILNNICPNRNAEKALARGSEDGLEDSNEWARVSELCDFGPRRGRDVARLRSIVLQLKQSGVRPKYPPRTTKV